MADQRSPITGQPVPQGQKFTSSTARENGAKGGKRTQARKKQMKALRQELEELLAAKTTDRHGKKVTVQRAMSARLIDQAMHGSVRAFEVIRDTIGQRPVDEVNMNAALDVGGLNDLRAELRERMAEKKPVEEPKT